MSSDKSAIERTQELLNERGVKHVGHGGMVRWINENGCLCRAFTRLGDQSVDVAILGTTPEQAIAATLGRGTCHEAAFCSCSECGAQLDGIYGHYCPNCGRRVVEVDE